MCFCQSARLFISVTVDMVTSVSLWTGEGAKERLWLEKAVAEKFCVEMVRGVLRKSPAEWRYQSGVQGGGFCQHVGGPGHLIQRYAARAVSTSIGTYIASIYQYRH